MSAPVSPPLMPMVVCMREAVSIFETFFFGVPRNSMRGMDLEQLGWTVDHRYPAYGFGAWLLLPELRSSCTAHGRTRS